MGLDRERKMALKIAVCWSGQLRLNYKENIERMKKFLPDADFYYTTWDNQPQETFINKVYTEPKSHYNPSKKQLEINLKLLRKLRNNEINVDDLPQRFHDGDKNVDAKASKGLAKLERECLTGVTHRIRSRNHTKQHIAHALTVKDFVTGKGYDIVIRARYDTFIRAEMKCHIKEFCQWVYDNKQPMGFHSYNNSGTLEECIKPSVRIHNMYGNSCHDFMIIHREDMFDPRRTLQLYERKIQSPAEHGWYKILCEPYFVRGVDCTGLTKIGAQHADHVQWFHERYHEDPSYVRYNFGESLQEAQDDIYRLL